jgi:hypothetical protein
VLRQDSFNLFKINKKGDKGLHSKAEGLQSKGRGGGCDQKVDNSYLKNNNKNKKGRPLGRRDYFSTLRVSALAPCAEGGLP